VVARWQGRLFGPGSSQQGEVSMKGVVVGFRSAWVLAVGLGVWTIRGGG
jgi:hypothetical protein